MSFLFGVTVGRFIVGHVSRIRLPYWADQLPRAVGGIVGIADDHYRVARTTNSVVLQSTGVLFMNFWVQHLRVFCQFDALLVSVVVKLSEFECHY